MCMSSMTVCLNAETRVKLRLELIKLKATELFDHLKVNIAPLPVATIYL